MTVSKLTRPCPAHRSPLPPSLPPRSRWLLPLDRTNVVPNPRPISGGTAIKVPAWANTLLQLNLTCGRESGCISAWKEGDFCGPQLDLTRAPKSQAREPNKQPRVLITPARYDLAIRGVEMPLAVCPALNMRSGCVRIICAY